MIHKHGVENQVSQKYQISILDTVFGLFLVSIILAAGSKSGQYILVPATGIAVIFVSAKSGIQLAFQQYDWPRRLVLMLFALSLFSPCVEVAVIIGAENVRFKGIECLFISIGYLVSAVAHPQKIDNLSLLIVPVGVLCSLLCLFFCFKYQDLNQNAPRVHIGIRFLVGVAATVSWLIPLALPNMNLGFGFFTWAVSINALRLTLTYSWTEFWLFYALTVFVVAELGK